MARKEPDPPYELDPLKGGLKHNPFAALRAKVEKPGVPIELTAVDGKQGDTGQQGGMRSPGSSPEAAHSAEIAPGSRKGGSTASSAKSGAAKPLDSKHERAPATRSGSAAAKSSAPKRGPSSAPPQSRVTVRIERIGRGGKTVTIAEGPGLAGHELEPLAREIARGMGTGARVESATIVVQGDQRERLVDWLATRGFAGAVSGN